MRSLGTFLCEQQVGAATGDRRSYVESSALWARITAPHPSFPWASQSVRDSKCSWMWVLWQSASCGCARCLIQLLQHPPRRLTALPGGAWGASEIDFGVTQAAVGNIDSAGSQLLTLVSLHSISQGNPVPMVWLLGSSQRYWHSKSGPAKGDRDLTPTLFPKCTDIHIIWNPTAAG